VKRVVLGVSLACVFAFPAPVGAAIEEDRALRIVRKIASWGPRPAGSANERRTTNLVANHLTSYGYAVNIQRFTLPHGQISRNAVGRTPGPLKVIVVAHMDGVYNTVAANDNGSGVATMLEVARALAQYPGVLVAGLGAEERHVTGSAYHLGSRRLIRSLSQAEKDSLRFALSLDMVGVGPTLNVRGLEAEPNRSARRALAAARALGFSASYLRDTGSSDHAEMTRAGMRAAWLTWRWDPCWHQPCDRPHRISKFKLKQSARLTAKAARTIVG
jgi:Zn-dependent M28 family amino/carboxypeptidase